MAVAGAVAVEVGIEQAGLNSSSPELWRGLRAAPLHFWSGRPCSNAARFCQQTKCFTRSPRLSLRV